MTYTDYDKARIIAERIDNEDIRSEFMKDRDRILYSSAFRILQGKTQVYMADMMDISRTRLTHSLEVAQIAKSIGIKLGLDPDLLEAIALAHDIGHPPFGHIGEEALNEVCIDGFEANAHNIIVLTFLENKWSKPNIKNSYGLNLTRATLDGLLKYKTTRDKNKKKFLYTYDFYRKRVDWIDPNWVRDIDVEEKRSIECMIVDWADKVAYSVHDFEDAILRGYLKSQYLTDDLLLELYQYLPYPQNITKSIYNWIKKIIQHIENTPSEIKKKSKLKKISSKLIHTFITNIDIVEIDNTLGRYGYKLAYRKNVLIKNKLLRTIENILIYNNRKLLKQRREYQKIIKGLYNVFYDKSSKRLYPKEYREYWDFFEADVSDEWRSRIACWYIASMTDYMAIKIYNKLYSKK
ncbi:MAG: dNTP triphosphohydrolase [Candidatus Micrarchaeia archaeon]